MRRLTSILTSPYNLNPFRDFLSIHRQLSPHTVSNYLRDVGLLLAHYPSPLSMTVTDCHNFLSLPIHRSLGPRSRARRLSAIRCFWRFLAMKHPDCSNPWAIIKGPRVPRRLPRVVATPTLIKALDSVDDTTLEGIRLRAILECLFGLGLRVSELVQLNYSDWRPVDHELRIRGKGRKERLVVVGPTVIRWVGHYIQKVRSEWASATQPALWVSKRGTRLTVRSIQRLIKSWGIQNGVMVTPHGLRHSFATAMLEGGASLDVIQNLLGHASIDATQIYTHVTPTRLSALHRQSPLGGAW